MTLRATNEWLAEQITQRVATMGCAYIFAVLAVLGLPQAWHDSFAGGFHPLLLVNWLSQTFIQLVMLSIIMVGQKRGGDEQTAAIAEILGDEREAHEARHAAVMERLDA